MKKHRFVGTATLFESNSKHNFTFFCAEVGYQFAKLPRATDTQLRLAEQQAEFEAAIQEMRVKMEKEQENLRRWLKQFKATVRNGC